MVNSVFLVHGVMGSLGGIAMLLTRGKLLLPNIKKPETLATDAFGCALLALGLTGLLVWPQPTNPTKQAVAAAFTAYHLMVTTGATLQATRAPEKSGPGAKQVQKANLQQGWGSVLLHGGMVVWFLAWLTKPDELSLV